MLVVSNAMTTTKHHPRVKKQTNIKWSMRKSVFLHLFVVSIVREEFVSSRTMQWSKLQQQQKILEMHAYE